MFMWSQGFRCEFLDAKVSSIFCLYPLFMSFGLDVKVLQPFFLLV